MIAHPWRIGVAALATVMSAAGVALRQPANLAAVQVLWQFEAGG